MHFIRLTCIYFIMMTSISILASAQQQATQQPMSDLERELWGVLSLENPNETLEVVSLLEKGVDPNAVITDITRRRSRLTLFLFAISHNDNLEVIKALFEHDADINATSDDGETALDRAIRSNRNPEIIRFLLENGAITNYTPLHLAVRLEDVEVIRNLLENGANPNAVGDSRNLTPLHLAAEFSESLAITRVLLEYGADPNATPRVDIALEPLHMAVRYNSNLEITRALLENGADPTSTLNNGTHLTALYFAVFSENLGATIALLEHGADPNATVTPLYRAAIFNETPETAKALLAYGANPDFDLLGFEEFKNNEIVKVLKDFGRR